jgi:hypothetical protein
MKDSSITTNPKDIEQLDLFQKDQRDVVLDDYKDLELELVESSRQKFLTWNDF